MDLLKDASIESGSFKNLDFSKREFKSKEITDTTFTRCVFAEASFVECRFQNCTFNKCDLSMLRVKSSQFSEVQFEECKTIGINWTEASWQKSGFLRLIDFNNCTLNYSSFFGLKLKNIKITRFVAREVDFGEADLTGGLFDGTDFAGSLFMHTDLTEADLANATGYSISAKNNVLKKTRFSLPEAVSLLYGLDIVLVDPSDPA
jgi:fluoroquinolone resistance protein